MVGIEPLLYNCNCTTTKRKNRETPRERIRERKKEVRRNGRRKDAKMRMRRVARNR